MENAINRIGKRFIKCNDFVISVMDEFGIQPPTMEIEKHLRSLYKTFPGSDKSKVDSCALLCTYLSITFSKVIQHSSKRVFNGFCDIYAPDDDLHGCISIQDALNVLSIGCVSVEDFEQCKYMLLSSIKMIHTNITYTDDGGDHLKRKSIPKERLEQVLDENPSILIQFRDRIMNQFHEEKRLELLKSSEVSTK